MVGIHLYGQLQHYARKAGTNPENIIRLDTRPDDTVESLLKRVGINVDTKSAFSDTIWRLWLFKGNTVSMTAFPNFSITNLDYPFFMNHPG
jgi:hypothetical protein